MVADLERRIGLRVVDASLTDLVDVAAGRSWTRDPFDRLISSHATLARAKLLTADETILAALPESTRE